MIFESGEAALICWCIKLGTIYLCRLPEVWFPWRILTVWIALPCCWQPCPFLRKRMCTDVRLDWSLHQFDAFFWKAKIFSPTLVGGSRKRKKKKKPRHCPCWSLSHLDNLQNRKLIFHFIMISFAVGGVFVTRYLLKNLWGPIIPLPRNIES